EPGVYGPAGELWIDDVNVLPNPGMEAQAPAPNAAAAQPEGFGISNGSFEKLDSLGRPAGWLWSSDSKIKLAEEEGNHFVRLTNNEPGSSTQLPAKEFRLDPSWKQIKLSARMRAKDFKVGTDTWHDARVAC